MESVKANAWPVKEIKRLNYVSFLYSDRLPLAAAGGQRRVVLFFENAALLHAVVSVLV
jgi:hypothetical protein